MKKLTVKILATVTSLALVLCNTFVMSVDAASVSERKLLDTKGGSVELKSLQSEILDEEVCCQFSRQDEKTRISPLAETRRVANIYGWGSGTMAYDFANQRWSDDTEVFSTYTKNSDGFVMSEGSGILFLEELEHAKARGAHIVAEMIGYGASGDGYHITSPAPGGEGGVLAFKQALKNAEIDPSEVDYVNAHGTSTHLNDLYETQALKTVFGEHARKMSISSTKGVMGHGLGAAGGFETIICAKALETGIVPPTINYEYPDPECDLDYTPNTARQANLKVAINTNLGFGGHNGVTVLRKYE